jgi:hypothetical protein
LTEIHPLLVNVERFNELRLQDESHKGQTNEALAAFDVEISRRVIRALPEYFGDPHRFMRGPVDLVLHVNGESDDICTVAARTHDFKAEYTLELAQDQQTRLGIEEAREVLTEIMAGEIAAEMKLLWGDRYWKIFPYIPVFGKLGIDSETFQPTVKFFTRYGELP